MKPGVIVGSAMMVSALVVYYLALAYEGGVGVEQHRSRSVQLLLAAGGLFGLGMGVLAVTE